MREFVDNAPPGLFPDWGLKLARADKHVESLHAEAEAWTAANPYRITREREKESGFTVTYAEPLSQPPPKLSLIFGDALHNLRGCLDYIALILNERGHGRPLSEGAENACNFPISRTKELFAEACRSIIPHVTGDPLAVIKAAQPYHRGEDWERHPLAVLRRLSDFDKHRRLPLIASYARLEAADVPSRGWEVDKLRLTFPTGILKAKTELLRTRGLTDLTGTEVEVDLRLSMHVAFDEGAPTAVVNERIRAVLDTLFMYVGNEVVLPLKPYLE